MSHPAVDGRERELRRLADAVRDLTAAINDHVADAETTGRWAAELSDIVSALRATAGEPFGRFGTMADGDPMDIFPFDVMLGRFNPLAPPIEVEWSDPDAIGTATLSKVYEGPPGCVHGAIIIAGFDQVFNVANIQSGVPGMTATLSVDYKRPTLLGEPLEYRCRVDRVDGRKVHAVGTLSQNGSPTCRAEGLFITF